MAHKLSVVDSDEDFRNEIRDRVADLEVLVLALERAFDEGKTPIESVHLILRHAHSLKGTLAMADRPAASGCLHTMETAFVAVREGRCALSRPFFSAALATLDHLAALAGQPAEDTAAFGQLAATWTSLHEGASSEPVRAHAGLPFALLEGEVVLLRAACAEGHNLHLVEKSIPGSISRASYEGLAIYGDIASLGTLVARRPLFEQLDATRRDAVLLLLVATALDAPSMARRIFDPLRAVELSPADREKYLAAREPAPHQGTLKSLIVEDDFTSRLVLQRMLAPLGQAHVAVHGEEAVAAVKAALDAAAPYQLICLDIMMPGMDGHAVLRALRRMEAERGLDLGKGAKVVMTTSHRESQHVMDAFRAQCDAYIVKPVERARLLEQLRTLGLLASGSSVRAS